LTLHPNPGPLQGSKGKVLCTTCEVATAAVEGRGKLAPSGAKSRPLRLNPGPGGAKQASGADFHS
jgi:hypothetical protein